jgi:hypothetical protein
MIGQQSVQERAGIKQNYHASRTGERHEVSCIIGAASTVH